MSYEDEGTNQHLGHETRTQTYFVAIKYKMALIHLLERFHLHTLPNRVLPELNGTRISCSNSSLLITIMQNPNLFLPASVIMVK